MDTKKQSYLSLDERFTIEAELSSFKSFKYIADILGRDASAISREVRRNYTLTQRNNNIYDCSTFLHCRLRNLCGDMECRYFCRFCKKVACGTERRDRKIAQRDNRRFAFTGKGEKVIWQLQDSGPYAEI